MYNLYIATADAAAGKSVIIIKYYSYGCDESAQDKG